MARFIPNGSVMDVEIRFKGQVDKSVVLTIVQKANVDLDFAAAWWRGRIYPDPEVDEYTIAMVKVDEIAMVSILRREIINNTYRGIGSDDVEQVEESTVRQ